MSPQHYMMPYIDFSDLVYVRNKLVSQIYIIIYKTVFVSLDQKILFTRIILLWYTVMPQGNHQFKTQSTKDVKIIYWKTDISK